MNNQNNCENKPFRNCYKITVIAIVLVTLGRNSCTPEAISCSSVKIKAFTMILSQYLFIIVQLIFIFSAGLTTLGATIKYELYFQIKNNNNKIIIK